MAVATAIAAVDGGGWSAADVILSRCAAPLLVSCGRATAGQVFLIDCWFNFRERLVYHQPGQTSMDSYPVLSTSARFEVKQELHAKIVCDKKIRPQQRISAKPSGVLFVRNGHTVEPHNFYTHDCEECNE